MDEYVFFYFERMFTFNSRTYIFYCDSVSQI